MKFPIVILIFFVLFATSPTYGQKQEPAASTISPDLLKNANAVIRTATTNIEMLSPVDIIITRSYTITVLNEKGNKYARINEKYNSLSSIRAITGAMYDKNGKEVCTINKKMIRDNVGNMTAFFDDERSKEFEFQHSEYPYTCIFSIVSHYSTSFTLPYWVPQPGHDVAVEHASINVTYPTYMKVTHKQYHMGAEPVATRKEGKNRLVLNVERLPAYRLPDELTPDENFYSPAMVLMIPHVELKDFSGDLSTWKGFGAFVYALNANRDQLTKKTAAELHRLTDTCKSVADKVNLLYEYLKKNTRYVNTSMEISGWQTLDALFVDEKGYGDCKDLSNYMKALLREAGVTSYQALIYGGQKGKMLMDEDYPYQVFNHVLLCVPGIRDTIWLDCTSKTAPAQYLSEFTTNRQALLLTPEGGYVVRTPKYHYTLGRMARCAVINVDENDDFKGTIQCSYAGIYWEGQRMVLDNGKETNDKYFNSKFAMSTYTTSAINITTAQSSGIPIINEQLSVAGSGFISHGANRVFVSPRVFSFYITEPENYEETKDAFKTTFDGDTYDTTIIHLTGNYEAERLPSDINYDLPFGSYQSKTIFENGNTIKIIIHCTELSGVYPGTLYTDYKKMSKAIKFNMAYNKIILKKIS